MDPGGGGGPVGCQMDEKIENYYYNTSCHISTANG